MTDQQDAREMLADIRRRASRTDIPRLAAALTSVLDLCTEADRVYCNPDADAIQACITKALGGAGE